MQVPDVFHLNDWEIRRFFIVILSLLLIFWGSIILSFLKFPIPLIQQISGFLSLTFVPGLLLLRVLRMHNLSAVRTTVYSVGLSLAVLMITGFFMNIVYPFFGITYPISLWPIVLTISSVVVLLSILAYLRDRTFSSPDNLNLQELLSPPVLALSLLPFGAVAGTYLMNNYGINSVLMILLPIIALIPVVIACTPYIPEKYYPYAVFSVALTLLYHTALISMYVWGWDIQYEYYLTSTVIQNGLWDPTIHGNCNAMLSLVMIVPFYSIALNLGLDWVFKIIYPFLFALVPLGLYSVFNRQTNGKIAFLACFFFMSLFVFYTEMLALARQEIAELFCVLIILSMIDRDLNKIQRSFFLLVFSMSLIVSHYGLSYLTMFILLGAWALATAGSEIQKLIDQTFAWIQRKVRLLSGLHLQKYTFHPTVISSYFVLFYGIFVLIWYIYISSSSSFDSIVQIAHHITTSISSELLSPDAAQGLKIITTKEAATLHEVNKYLQLLTMLFIAIGFMVSFVRQKEVRFDLKYLLMAFGALCICICGVTLPYFASALNTSRLYQFSLIFLAPFCIIGGTTVFSGFKSLVGDPGRSLQIFSIFLSIFLLFNCGWIYEVSQDDPTSFALNGDIDSASFNIMEVYGVDWLSYFTDGKRIYGDDCRRLLIKRYFGNSQNEITQDAIKQNRDDTYIFLGTLNIETIKSSGSLSTTTSVSSVRFAISSYLCPYNVIYTCGGSKIYSL